jgi:hypothetical protein
MNFCVDSRLVMENLEYTVEDSQERDPIFGSFCLHKLLDFLRRFLSILRAIYAHISLPTKPLYHPDQSHQPFQSLHIVTTSHQLLPYKAPQNEASSHHHHSLSRGLQRGLACS